MEEALDDWLYSSEGESLEQIVLYYLGLRQATLAVAESCTGGLVAQRITGVPGSSRSFLGGAVVYSDPLKTSFAGVPPELIAQHGAVSAEVASAMAEGIRKRTGATLGVGVTGIAGSAIVDGYQELFQYNAGADHIYIAPPQLTNQLAPSDSCTFVLIWNGALRITPIRIDVNLSLFLSASCTIERITGMS